MTSSSGTKVVAPSATGTKRGSISLGTLMRANVRVSVTGSRRRIASESDRLEMYGKGRPRPTASGVEHGEDLAPEALGQRGALVVVDLVPRNDADAVLGERRA